MRNSSILLSGCFLVTACGEEPTPRYEYVIPPPITECYAAALPGLECADVGPAPSTEQEIAGYILSNALPLFCSRDLVDLRVVDALFAGNSIFMMGEVHGSNEIGQLSAEVFERLVRESGVRTLAFEMPIDFQVAFQDYIHTGNNYEVEQIQRAMAENMFVNTLTAKAREMVELGLPISVGLVDSPYGTEIAVHAIEQACQGLVIHRGLVLDSLPEAVGPYEYYPSQPEIDAVFAYVDAVMADSDAICAELDNEQACDTLTSMTLALWTATALFDPSTDIEDWFAVREQVIYYNLRQLMVDDQTKMYMHMGAFHTNKLSDSAGSRMAHEFARTQGKVVSVAPAYGEGSEIWYQEVMELDPSPPAIAQALADASANPHFVSTSVPGVACNANPLREMQDDTMWAPMARVYDGYFHIRQLTPETRPDDTTLPFSSVATPVTRVWHRFDQVRSIERQVLQARRPSADH